MNNYLGLSGRFSEILGTSLTSFIYFRLNYCKWDILLCLRSALIIKGSMSRFIALIFFIEKGSTNAYPTSITVSFGVFLVHLNDRFDILFFLLLFPVFININ